MSTVPGRIQRALLDIIEGSDGLLETFELAGRAYRIEPNHEGRVVVTNAQVTSVRRALRKLALEDRIVSVGRGFHDRRARWASKASFTAYQGRRKQLEAMLAPLRHF